MEGFSNWSRAPERERSTALPEPERLAALEKYWNFQEAFFSSLHFCTYCLIRLPGSVISLGIALRWEATWEATKDCGSVEPSDRGWLRVCDAVDFPLPIDATCGVTCGATWLNGVWCLSFGRGVVELLLSGWGKKKVTNVSVTHHVTLDVRS